MQSVTLPNAIFGNFSILVLTDLYNDVYEHNDEDDNLKAKVISSTTFEVFPHLTLSAFCSFRYKLGKNLAMSYTAWFAQKCKVIYERGRKSHARYITFPVDAHAVTEDSHNTGNFMPYSFRIVCRFFNVPH